MLSLSPIPLQTAQKYFADLQKKSKYLEIPPQQAEYLGIYEEDRLVGYFATLAYANHSIDIVHGYLTKEARHKRYPKQAMLLLEAIMRRQGFTKVRLMTHNRFSSYIEFADGLGYSPKVLLFEKEL